MRIGIIGAGNIGGNLARGFARLGHEVRVANSRGPQTLTELAGEPGVTPVEATAAADGADLLVVTVPQKNVPDLPAGILDGAADGTVVVDTGNYYPRERDGRIDALETGTVESVWASTILDPAGRLRWVKAFNGIHAEHLLTAGRPAGAPDRRALPVAGDDAAAKAAVVGLLDALGFDGVDAGSLADSWRQQPATPVYGLEADVAGVTEALAAATPERTAAFSA